MIFRMEKSYLGFDVFRVHTEGKLESKIFISFIALIIRNEIHNLTKPLYKKNRKENTVPKILKQIERLGLTKLSDEKYHIRYALTKRQKQLLGIVGISEEKYISIANEIIGQFK